LAASLGKGPPWNNILDEGTESPGCQGPPEKEKKTRAVAEKKGRRR